VFAATATDPLGSDEVGPTAPARCCSGAEVIIPESLARFFAAAAFDCFDWDCFLADAEVFFGVAAAVGVG